MVTRIAARQVASRVANTARAAGGMLGLAGERMSKVDTAWLRMDSASNLMEILGVWVLRPGIDYDKLCARVQEKLLAYPRFRQRVHEDAAGASWVAHDVDIRRHARRVLFEPNPLHDTSPRLRTDRAGCNAPASGSGLTERPARSLRGLPGWEKYRAKLKSLASGCAL